MLSSSSMVFAENSIFSLPRLLISSPLYTFSRQGASFVSCACANFFVRPLSCLFSYCAGIKSGGLFVDRVSTHVKWLATLAGLE